LVHARADPTIDLVPAEKAKIKGAVRTDFILSAEIIVIALGVVADAPFPTRVAVLVGIALLMTIGVYGLVGGIVKLDDAGQYLSRRDGHAMVARIQRGIGASILETAPVLMKGLSIAGTAAMFLVGGGILAHEYSHAAGLDRGSGRRRRRAARHRRCGSARGDPSCSMPSSVSWPVRWS
jgi:predicted DNA repair protein MutK